MKSSLFMELKSRLDDTFKGFIHSFIRLTAIRAAVFVYRRRFVLSGFTGIK
jgi:hypothetical protein